MSILIDKNTRLCVQGISGKTGAFHTRGAKEYGTNVVAGVTPTAGGLVFTGEGNGHFNAFDAKTGKKLWSFQCGAGVNSPPVSYMVDGKQYIAVAAAGNNQLDFKRGNSIFVFALP